ncbi:MAG: sensor histidine kinase [Chloroflexia bacterium]
MAGAEGWLPFWANTVMTALQHEDGRLRGFAMVMRDITARMEAEVAEREQRVLAEALQDTALVLVGSLTLDEVLERILEQVGRVVPHEAAEITVLEPDGGTRVRRKGNLLPGEVRCHVGAPIVVKGRTVGFLGLDSATPDAYTQADADRLRAFAAQAGVAIENARLYEEVRGYAQALEARVAERTAALEAANRELEAFAYSVSHDLRAPLRAIDGFTRVLQEEYGAQLPPRGQHYLERVRQGVAEMSALIDDLLALSRVSRQAVRQESVEPAALVREVLAGLQKEIEGRRVEIAIGALPPCRGDPLLLRQVWWNLLANAIKFTRKREVAHIEVGAREEGAEVVYFVRDNGAGFDPRYAERLFRVFERLHPADEYEGTGVGLAIVRRIVERHGGRVWAEGAVDRGATFYFALGGGGAGGSGK